MDKRMDERMDVGLAGDRRNGGDHVGRLNYQGIQEIMVRSRPAREVRCHPEITGNYCFKCSFNLTIPCESQRKSGWT
jgi:hypothetical protein